MAPAEPVFAVLPFDDLSSSGLVTREADRALALDPHNTDALLRQLLIIDPFGKFVESNAVPILEDLIVRTPCHDRRLVKLCARLGPVEFWLATGKWPDCAHEVPYDFRAASER
jgi:hypothetical protein